MLNPPNRLLLLPGHYVVVQDRACWLTFVLTPENMPGEHAVLSHVWDKHETDFQDIQASRVRCAESPVEPLAESPTTRALDDAAASANPPSTSPIMPHDIVSRRKEGHEYGQAGTCGIDKTGSAELTRVINSMYHPTAPSPTSASRACATSRQAQRTSSDSPNTLLVRGGTNLDGHCRRRVPIAKLGAVRDEREDNGRVQDI
ncbi:hypothetical protein BD309DRAFT_968510 [Dichomitus squalens]|uniref:Uncharacterized protein n=1 Tax=Dichomitus squalens TaxID=114155 RepID=A0A4Q9NHI0_9APHY|nr:hypothetical protein BD309DRAFT_968510 [Dichomitus squalens]TBU56753.1 hypothetical protein BD310DRAFT_930701 [Dichomitus squalens]